MPEGKVTLTSVQAIHNDEGLEPEIKWYYGHSLIANMSDTPVKIWLYPGSCIFTTKEQAARAKKMVGGAVRLRGASP